MHESQRRRIGERLCRFIPVAEPAAREPARRGRSVCLLEATATVGGRIGTELYQGYRLDRGFQALQTAYPDARSALELSALDLRAFVPGSLSVGGSLAFRATVARRVAALSVSSERGAMLLLEARDCALLPTPRRHRERHETEDEARGGRCRKTAQAMLARGLAASSAGAPTRIRVVRSLRGLCRRRRRCRSLLRRSCKLARSLRHEQRGDRTRSRPVATATRGTAVTGDDGCNRASWRQ